MNENFQPPKPSRLHSRQASLSPNAFLSQCPDSPRFAHTWGLKGLALGPPQTPGSQRPPGLSLLPSPTLPPPGLGRTNTAQALFRHWVPISSHCDTGRPWPVSLSPSSPYGQGATGLSDGIGAQLCHPPHNDFGQHI